MPTRSVRVSTPSATYDALIGHDLRRRLGPALRAALPRARRAAVFIDKNALLASAHEDLFDSLRAAGFDPGESPRTLVATEATKTLATVENILAHLAHLRLERHDAVLAVGGGITGDLVGFAAATYRRGIPWANIPTTLLAMVDAAIGGKTAANLLVDGGLKKNMVGAFWQPALVAIDTATLKTLDDRAFRAGLAECLKHAMLAAEWGDPDLDRWTAQHLDAFAARDPEALTALIERNTALKARVVEADEREQATDEQGGRALLNLGHTFAHAIETLPHLTPDGDPAHAPLQHGEAVALGLVAVATASAALGLCPPDLPARTRALVARAGLPTRIVGLPPSDELIARMSHDKKVSRGRLRLIMPLGAGRCRLMSDPPRDALAAGWDALRA